MLYNETALVIRIALKMNVYDWSLYTDLMFALLPPDTGLLEDGDEAISDFDQYSGCGPD